MRHNKGNLMPSPGSVLGQTIKAFVEKKAKEGIEITEEDQQGIYKHVLGMVPTSLLGSVVVNDWVFEEYLANAGGEPS